MQASIAFAAAVLLLLGFTGKLAAAVDAPTEPPIDLPPAP